MYYKMLEENVRIHYCGYNTAGGVLLLFLRFITTEIQIGRFKIFLIIKKEKMKL